jgi:hypothetical protein
MLAGWLTRCCSRQQWQRPVLMSELSRSLKGVARVDAVSLAPVRGLRMCALWPP